MENIDYEQAKEQLTKIFNENIGHRHIVFWYDAPKNFYEDVKRDSFDNVKILIYENNPFTIKTILEIDDKESNYLVYVPYDKPKDAENWLIDTTLYSEEYYADIVALTMKKLNLTSNTLRSVVERHVTFFNAQSRIDALNKIVDVNDGLSVSEFELAMMSSLVKNTYNRIDYILKEIIFDNLEDGEKYKLLNKYGFRDLFWNLISEKYSYSGLENIKELRQSFLLTALSKKVDIKITTPILKNKIIQSNTEECEIFVDQILMADKRYIDLDKTVWDELKIGELISTKGIEALKSCDTFREFDEFITKSIITALANGSYDYDSYLRLINDKRVASRWYPDFEKTYNFILELIRFYKSLNIEIEENQDAEKYIHDYCKDFWKVDNAYRHVISTYRELEEQDDNETKLINDVDNRYESNFLNRLGQAFSKSLKAKEPDFSFGSVKLSKDFFRSNVDRGNKKKQFVIISDALRYEVGEDLVKAINLKDNFKGKATLDYQISTLPSITMFGMASLLPNRALSYENKQVLVDGKSTKSTIERNAILASRSDGYAAITYDDIYKKTRDELRNYMKDKSLVYIYHDTIDNAGEHDETNVFLSCDKAIEEIVALIGKLYNTLQISNYIVTSDHGFVYRNKKIDESSKYSNISSMGFDDFSQRYIVVKGQEEVNFTNKFEMNYLGNCNSSVIVPYGYDMFKKSGGGIQYIHGGASLQELITPIITLSEMRSYVKGEIAEPVKVRLKSVNRRIMNKSFTLTFEQCEKVGDKKTEAHVKVFFMDEDQHVISDEKVFIANKTTDNINERSIDMRFLLKNLDYDRNKRYYLVMKNADTDELLETEIPFVIDIVKFKMF